MPEAIAVIWLFLVGIRGLLGVSARWPPSRWSLVVRRLVAVTAIGYGSVLLAVV